VLVTVVTPCLNPGPRLARCLESVAGQTYPEVEHIVVDGGSTDGTVELLERSGVRYVSEPDGGQTEAIAKGFASAGGELLTWLNADDVLRPKAIERAVAAAGEWVYGDCEVVDGSASRIWRPPRRFGTREVEAGEMVPQPGSCFTRAAYERAGGIDPSFHLAMDVDLWIRLVDAGVRAVYVPEALSMFEIHSGSKTGSVERRDFLLEHARALAKSGRPRGASAALGRAAALTSGDDRDASLDRVLEDAPAWVDVSIVRAGAAAELAVVAAREHRPVCVLRLLSPRIWRYRETRGRLTAGARRALSRG
jgi:GT2 family glycosyltransferase